MIINFDQFFARSSQDATYSNEEIQFILNLLRPDIKILGIDQLSGGFQNHNFRVHFDNQLLLLRIAKDLERANLENQILKNYSDQLPLPYLVKSIVHNNLRCSLIEFISGTLPNQLEVSAPDLEQLGEAIGHSLARVHSIQFSQGGFLDSKLEIVQPFGNQGQFWLTYMLNVLDGEQAKQRLGQFLCRQIIELLKTNAELILCLEQTNRLVHSDFNLKNMLVERINNRWIIQAILDWEFAHAGSPLVDIANFLRFEDVLPQPLITGFLDGYQTNGGQLSEYWREQSLLLDLASMCNFIERLDAEPITIQTAKMIFRKTLKKLS